tara:strand:- start:30 stop:818 length:789 start_codon:yes stop_codon:yes gene_type:complete
MNNYPEDQCPKAFVTKTPKCVDMGSGVVPLDNIFKFNNGCARLTDKSKNIHERENYSKWYKEQICMFGTEILYQAASNDLTTYDPLYGEDADQSFSSEVKMIFYIEMNENALTLSQFGINSDDEVTAYIHIDNFFTSMGGKGDAKKGGIEPKAGDIFRLYEYGNDRVFPRDGSLYEITERLDQDIEKINPLMGHYIWLIKAKRFDYSFEGNVTAEGGSKQVDEDSIYDPYMENDEQWSTITSNDIYDYGDYGGGDAVYGDYY